MVRFAVTGASGALGRLAVHALLDRGVPPSDVVALARTPGKADDLARLGVQVRQADYLDRPSLVAGLAGVTRLLLVSSSEAGRRVEHHTNVIEAARTAGVARIVYTSMLKADTSSNPLAGEHEETETVLRAATVPFVSLRNGWYTENYTDQLDTYLNDHEIVGAADGGSISAAVRDDYAEAAAAVLLDDAEPESETIHELGGPAFTLSDLARTITGSTGVPVAYRDLSVEDYVRHLTAAGTDEGTARFVAALDASSAHGDLHTDSQDLAVLLGRAPIGLDAAIARARSRTDRSEPAP